MATSQKDLEGWQVITTDEHGRVTTGSRRRSRKNNSVENVYIQRISDGLSFGRGDTVVTNDSVTKTYSVYLVHEIRQNTLNNLIEIWAFSYLRFFELNAKKYYSQFNPDMLHKGLSKIQLQEKLITEVNHNELYITAELSEIWLKDFKYIAQVYTKEDYDLAPRDMSDDPKDFFVRYICEPTAESFVKVDINKEVKKIKLMEPKASEERLKQMTVSMNRGFSKKSSSSSSFHTSFKKNHHQLKERRVDPDIKTENDSSINISTSSTSATPATLPQQQSKSNLFNKESHSDENISNLSDSQMMDNDNAAPMSSESDSDTFTSADDGHSQIQNKHDSLDDDLSGSDIDEDSFVVSNDASLLSDSSVSTTPSSNIDNIERVSDIAVGAGGDDEEEEDDDENNSEVERIHRKRQALRMELNGPQRKERKVSKPEKPQSITNDSDSEEDIPLSKRKTLSATTLPDSSQSQDSSTTATKQKIDTTDKFTQHPKQVRDDIRKLKNKYMKLKSKFKTANVKDDTANSNIPAILSNSKTGSKQIDIAALESNIRPNIPNNKKSATIFSRLKIKGRDEDKSINEEIQEYIALPARSKEFARCYMEIFDSLRKNESKAVYISGRSGSGKTSIVQKLLIEFEKSSEYKELSLFKTVILNRRTVGKEFYKYIWDRLSGNDELVTSSSAAERALEFFFTSVDKNRKRHTLIVLDDLDILCNESPNLLYNFFHWTTYPNSKLVVIAVGQNPDLPKQTLGKHVLSGINYHSITFENYSCEELLNIVQYRLETLKNNYNFKVYQVKDTGNLVFEKMQEDNKQSGDDEDDYKMVNVYMSDKTIDAACKQICLTNNSAESALRVIDDASDYVMKEYVAIQSTIMKRNKGLVITKLPDNQEIGLNAILKSLSQTNDIVTIDIVNKLSYIEKLFLFSCFTLARSKKTLILETEDIYEKMAQLVNNNKTNRFIKNILRVLISDYESIIGDKKLHRDSFEILNWNKIIMSMVSLQFLVIVKQDDKNINHINSIKLKISLSDLSSGLDLTLID